MIESFLGAKQLELLDTKNGGPATSLPSNVRVDRALVQSETTPFQHRMHSAVTFKTLHTGPDQDH